MKELPNGFCVDVLSMAFNYRVVRTELDGRGYDRAWCYIGKDMETFTSAVLGALLWDGGDDTAPDGWHKNAMTGEYSDEGREVLDGRRRHDDRRNDRR